MADSNNPNRGNDHTVAAEDPFAELARLLSGDDNEQAPEESRTQPEPVTNEPAAEAAESDPFAVDLERELLGELEDAEAAPATDAAERPEDMPGGDQIDASDHPNADETGAFETVEEPDIWTGDEHAAAEDGPFPEEAPAHASAGDDTVAEETGEADFDGNVEPVLADIDMDFGDLDAGNVDQVEAASPEGTDPQVDDLETSEAVSLEDELEMLLADPSEQSAHAPATGSGQAGAVAEAASRLGRANYVNAQSSAQSVETGVWHESSQPVDDWEDNGGSAEDFADADISEFEGAVADDAEPSIDPHTDAFADLAAIMANSGAAGTPAKAEQPAIPVDIETIDVPEAAFEQADDLQLPDLPADEPAPQHPDDEFEADLAYDFQLAASEDNDEPGETPSEGVPGIQNDEDRFYAEALGFGTAAGAGASFGSPAYARQEPTEPDVDLALEEALSVGDDYTRQDEESRGGRNGFLIAGVVVAIALIGGIGAFALSFGGGDEPETPVLVEADSDPVKVKPESPGGAAVPAQDSAAHEVASGVANTEPRQESLVSTTEEPVNIASRTVGAERLPGVDEPATDTAAAKSEDRLEPAANEAETALANDVIAVQPRRVRTMIVRPDGTLVPREEPAAPATEAAAQPAPEVVETSQPVRQIETTQPAATQPVGATAQDSEPAATASEASQQQTVADAEAPATSTAETAATEDLAAAADPVTPTVGPVATPRPANRQTATQPQQVAQAAPAARTEPATPAPAPVVVEENSTWSMQIASQPTAESAQATYQDLARRYGELLGGRGVNIVRAEIPGKGTYYRVRIPTTSRADGIALCERYKAIGGSCFVSK
ncbi:MAG: SPOR domain-containing protein [Rhizobiaceae bacterium]|nr:SPOR domain-containing protein [Rhizobiaceae bacterium]